MSTAIAVEFPAIDPYDLPLNWAEACPGPELAIQLARVDWSSLSDRELVDAMAAARRQATWAQSVMLEGVGELTRRRHRDDPVPSSERHRRICGEVSLELTVTTSQAEELVWLAETLPGRLPATWTALRTGRIDYPRARTIADGLAALDDELAARLEAELAAQAADTTTTLLRRRLARAVKKADPDAAAQRTKRARDQRRVELWDNQDDTCDLTGRHLNANDAHAIYNKLTAAAQAMKADGDPRPIDHIRLDLYRDLLRGIPLPQAIHHHLVDSPPHEPPDDPPADGHAASDLGGTKDGGESASTGRSAGNHQSGRRPNPPAGATADFELTATEVELRIATALAQAADQHLTELFDRARAEGRLDGMARMIGDAVQAMRDALDPFIDSWCRATNHTPTRGTPTRTTKKTTPTTNGATTGGSGEPATTRRRHQPSPRPNQTDRAARQLDQPGRHHRQDPTPPDPHNPPGWPGRHGHPGYRPPAALQRLIQRRHSTCVFPTCNRRAVHCDIDHTTPYDKGGRTCKCNTAPLCRTHHRVFKQHRQWKLVQLWPGLLIWIAPAGTWHIVLPE
jgi:hypothetical protein